MVDPAAERVARNDAIFRDANEKIAEAAVRLERERPVPFICECADPRCTTLVYVSLEEYAEIRRDDTHFLNAPGHDVAAGPHATVIERRDGYDIVEKLGEAAELVRELASDEAVSDGRS
jgi:hypothetical protein